MKTIGMLGGMSWESTLTYYTVINEEIKKRLGGLHSAKICLYSVDFAEIERLQHAGKWDETATILVKAAKSVEAGGADFLIICTNTMHKVAEEVESAMSIPLLHIAEATAQKLTAANIGRVGLLGTKFTMEQAFYKECLKRDFGIETLIPHEAQREVIHNIIYHELCLGKITDEARKKYLEIITDLHKRGVQAVILGCTEVALLVQQKHTAVPLYDTTAIHAQAAVAWATST